MTDVIEGQVTAWPELEEPFEVVGREASPVTKTEWSSRTRPREGELEDMKVIDEVERGLVTVTPPQRVDHHIVTGMATLARMDEASFQDAMTSIETGQRRMREFMQRAMVKGEDYGTVAGIDRPFLHLPGAEKLCLLYGLAARQEAERIIGERIKLVTSEGETIVTDGWQSPPLAYHVKTYIHLGSFDGPIVAQGYGEASSWETKYRYVNAKQSCPECGHELVKRKSPPSMAGKLNCANWGGKGGCNRVFEPNDPRISAGGKIDNPDPWSLAETLIQMAAKRSLVAATRRATGTSGLFTQDDDSPSVQNQANDGPDDPPPMVSDGPADVKVAAGGKTEQANAAQIAQLRKLKADKNLSVTNIGHVIERVHGKPGDPGLYQDDAAAAGRVLLEIVKRMTADELAAVLRAIDLGEVPPTEPDEALSHTDNQVGGTR